MSLGIRITPRSSHIATLNPALTGPDERLTVTVQAVALRCGTIRKTAIVQVL